VLDHGAGQRRRKREGGGQAEPRAMGLVAPVRRRRDQTQRRRAWASRIF
jgi:hypothetical protein